MAQPAGPENQSKHLTLGVGFHRKMLTLGLGQGTMCNIISNTLSAKLATKSIIIATNEVPRIGKLYCTLYNK